MTRRRPSPAAGSWRSCAGGCAGCSLLARIDGQCRAAAAACMATSRSMASGLSRLPVLAGNSGSAARPARSRRARPAVPADGEPVRGMARCLRPLPWQRTCAAGAEMDVGAVQAGQLGDPQPGLDGEQEQGTVAPASQRAPVRVQRCSASISSAVRKLTWSRLVNAWRVWPGPAGLRRRARVAQGGVAEQRPGSRPGGGCGFWGRCAAGLQVVQEGGDRLRVEVGRVQAGGRLAGSGLQAKPSSSRRVSR